MEQEEVRRIHEEEGRYLTVEECARCALQHYVEYNFKKEKLK